MSEDQLKEGLCQENNYKPPASYTPGYTPQQPVYAPQYGYAPQQPAYAQPVYQQQVYPQQGYAQPGYGQPPPQTAAWVPPPVQGNTNPNYNVLNIQYTQITVDQWSSIQNDQTQYSYLWSPDQFTPEKFAENQGKVDKCLNPICAVLFILNFIAWIAFIIVAKGKSLPNIHFNLDSNTVMDFDEMKGFLLTAVGICVGIPFAWTVVHFLYMSFLPQVYIKFGIIIGTVIVEVFFILVIYIFNNRGIRIVFGVIAAFILLIAVCCYCCLKEQIEFTWRCMEYSTKVLRKHLTIFLLVLVMMLINMLVSVIFAFSVVCIVLSSLHYATYIYSVFTLFWIQSTNYYIFYTICANVTAVTYFLEDTQYMPASPLLNAIKRSLTVTFGASCFAGILTAIVETLEDQFKAAIKKLPCHGCCCCCCIVECIISCCVKLIGDLNKLGLFYSTVYGVPYLEGCRRFLEMKVKKFIDVFIGECILDKASKWNSFFITQFSTCCVLFAAWKHITNLFPENQVQSETDYFDRTISIILLMIVYAVLNWAVQIVLNQALLVPVNTTCFATMICFAEYPNRLKSTNSELYEQFAYKYSYATAKASGQAPPQQPQVSQVSINV